MNQTKLGSMIESIINVCIGLSISFIANMLIFPLFGFDITANQNIVMAMIYTVISVVRSYCVRRWFNARLHAMAQAAAGKFVGQESEKTLICVLAKEFELKNDLVRIPVFFYEIRCVNYVEWERFSAYDFVSAIRRFDELSKKDIDNKGYELVALIDVSHSR